MIGCEGVYVDEPKHRVVPGCGLRNHEAAVGVRDEHDWLADSCDYVANVGGITLRRCAGG